MVLVRENEGERQRMNPWEDPGGFDRKAHEAVVFRVGVRIWTCAFWGGSIILRGSLEGS